jgi:hypothetical protein
MILERAAQGCAALLCAAVFPLLTEKAVNLNGIYIRNVKDKNK